MDYYYVAAKPVRFDRDYEVGEIIPNEVINLATIGRMITFGRVARIDPDTLPQPAPTAPPATGP